MARWGDFERRFPIFVYPLRVQGATGEPLAAAGAASR
jgi:hypothetical protein